jgi:hypothetical protein
MKSSIMQLSSYKIMALPCLMYDSETWTLRTTDERWFEAAEMQFLWYLSGCSVWDKEKSDEIRPELAMKKFNKETRKR